MKDSNMNNLFYTNINKIDDRLFVVFSLIYDEVALIKSDNDEMLYENININSKFDGYFRRSEDNDKENVLIYYDSEMGFNVNITANLSKEELIKIAENITY